MSVDGDMFVFSSTGAVINLPAVAITAAIIIILIIGVRQTTIVNLVFVILKIIVLLIFIFACCKYVNVNNYSPFFPGNEGMLSFDDIHIY